MKTIFRKYDNKDIYVKELNEQTVKLIGYFLGKQIAKVDKLETPYRIGRKNLKYIAMVY